MDKMDNISSKIEELQKKINLSESKKKSCYEEGEEEKLKNAHYIATLKENILSQKLTESTKASFSCVMKGPIYKDKQSRELVEWFDQWIFDTEKQINLLKHIERTNQETIVRMEDEKQRVLTQTSSGNDEELDIKKVQELENNLEKMHMKIIESEFVEKKYGFVISVLEEEITQLQKDSALLDSEVAKTKSELDVLKSTAENAFRASRAIQAQLLHESHQFQKQKQTWEHSLRSYHQQVDSICLDNNLRRKSIERLPSGNETFISCEESSSPATEGLTRSYSKDVMEKLRLNADSGETMIGVNDPGNQMNDTITQLQEKIANLQEEKERLQLELENTTGSAKLTVTNSAKHEQQNEKLLEQQQRKIKALKTLENYTKFMATVRASLRQLNTTIALGCKINSVGSPSPDDTIELLTTCMERVEYLVEQSQDFDRENAIQIYEGIKFNDNVEQAQLMLKPKSKSVKLAEEPVRVSIRLDDYQSPELEIPTRATIKRQAKTLIDHQAKLLSKGARGQSRMSKLDN